MVFNEMLVTAGTVTLSELGDKSQFASGFFGAKYNIVLVTLSLLIGLGIITYATIF